MIMTAQYRPYRGTASHSLDRSLVNHFFYCCLNADEDCVDGTETEHIGWPDHEPGIQIYEKTTEDIPFSRRKRSLLVTIFLTVFVGSVCFLVGFFSHGAHSECITQTVRIHTDLLLFPNLT